MRLPATEGLKAGIVAEHLLNFKLQMIVLGATEKVGTLTKQTKIRLYDRSG
jgi:hypothetical protein